MYNRYLDHKVVKIPGFEMFSADLDNVEIA